MSNTRVEALIREQGLDDVDSVARVLGAGGGCGSCRPDIEEILADRRGEPVLDSVRRANRLRGDAETLRRIDAALFVSIAARLPPGTKLELVGVDGLRVELRIAHGDSTDVRANIAERLRKLVCAELEIVYGGSASAIG
jgi:bacterioferritin-associated ferredoxin